MSWLDDERGKNIYVNDVPVPNRKELNFIVPGSSTTDDPVNGRTNLDLSPAITPRPGFEDANDASTASVPISLNQGSWTAIPNDAAGSFSNTAYLPGGISSLFDGATGKIDPTELTLGEAILVRNDFTVTPSVNGAYVQFRYTLGSGGGAYTLAHQLGSLSNGGGVPYRFQFTDYFYMGDENTRSNLIGLEVQCSESATMVNAGSVVQALRRAS